MLRCFVRWIPVNTFPSQGLALRRWVWSFAVTPLVESVSSPRAREFTCACILFATGRQVCGECVKGFLLVNLQNRSTDSILY